MAKKKIRTRGNGSGSVYKRSGGAYYISWYDASGKRREKNTKTSDRRAAERILNDVLTNVALRREGVINPDDERWATESRRPIVDLINEYIDHCTASNHDERHIQQKRGRLLNIVESSGLSTFGDLTADALEHHLLILKRSGLSARTLNFHRQIAVAFYEWAVKTQRARVNVLKVVSKQNEHADRRRVRRPLTGEELSKLLAVADERGRGLWYRLAVYAGLRRGDLIRLRWGDIDLEQRHIEIREGKAKRVDHVPIHDDLLVALTDEYQTRLPLPDTKVFPQAVTSRTQAKDFYRAGLARRYKHSYTNSRGNEVWEYRYDLSDEDGRYIDLHAMRTTLATRLAQAGVTPQLAQKILRHADYKTTAKHYTVLGLTDTMAAVNKVEMSSAVEHAVDARKRAE